MSREKGLAGYLDRPGALNATLTQPTDEEERLVARIIELATQYGRYGYRGITAMLQQED